MLSAAKRRPQEQPTAGPSTSVSAAPSTKVPGQEAMVQQFMKDSGMNDYWSREYVYASLCILYASLRITYVYARPYIFLSYMDSFHKQGKRKLSLSFGKKTRGENV